jgi:hypothetical protein
MTGELVTADVAFLTRQENFTEKFLAVLGFVSLPTPPREPSVDFRAFSLNTVNGPHTLLNGGLRRIPITLTWNCCRDFLNVSPTSY